MFNVTGGEVVILLVLALVVLGPEKLPDAIRRFGQAYGEFKRMSTSFQSEMREAFEEPMRELKETAGLLQSVIDEPVQAVRETANDATAVITNSDPFSSASGFSAGPVAPSATESAVATPTSPSDAAVPAASFDPPSGSPTALPPPASGAISA